MIWPTLPWPFRGGSTASRLPAIQGEGRGRSILLVAFLALGQASAAGAAAFATRDVFAALGEESPGLPLLALGLIVMAGFAIALLRVAERLVAERVGQNYAASLRLKLFKHLSQMPAREVSKRRRGALALRFVGDLTAVRGWVSLGIARLVSASIVLPLAAAVLFFLNADLAWAAVFPIVLGLVAMALIGPRLGPAHKKLRARRARLAADMSERVPHAPELRLLGRSSIEIAHLQRRTEKLIVSALERARGAALLRAVPDAVSGLAAAAVLWMALRSGAAGAEVAGALAAVGLMIQPLRDLAGVWDRHRAWIAARNKCQSILSSPRVARAQRQKERRQKEGGQQEGRPKEEGQRDEVLALSALPSLGPQELLFKQVSAGVLYNVNATAQAGQKIAIVGGNGSGKSTLLGLAAGLEAPAEGCVRLGGRAPTDLRAAERRKLLSLVGRHSPILAGSLRRALTMGAAERPEDSTILAQARAFGLGDAIERLGGLDGRVNEAGRNLSAGEARRLLLVRAALSKPSLMLLDEPDDVLDTDGPELIERLVRDSAATTLTITHSLAVARRMDQLWFIEDGRIVEAGPTDALLAGDGPAARFFAPRRAA